MSGPPGDTPWSAGSGNKEGLYSWVPGDCSNQGDGAWQATILRALYREQNEAHLNVFLWRGPPYFPWSCSSVAGFRFSTHLGSYGGALKKHKLWIPYWHIPSALLLLVNISQKTAYTFVFHPDFCDCCPGHTFRSPGSGGQWDLILQSHSIVYIFILLKAYAWGSGFQSTWAYARWPSTLRPTGPGTSSATGSY